MLKYTCDRCGKEISRLESVANVTFNATDTSIDLCEKCHIFLLKEICRTNGIMSKPLRDYCLIFLGPEYSNGQISINEFLDS